MLSTSEILGPWGPLSSPDASGFGDASAATSTPVLATAAPGPTSAVSSAAAIEAFGHYADLPAVGDAAPAAAPTVTAGTPSQGVEPADDAGDLARGLAHEGLGGLADLEGMLDRQRARRDLANRFEIIPDGQQGGHAHNQVTQQEYDALCKTYSDIRLGRGDLTLDTDEITDRAQAQHYRDAAMTNLADLMMTTSGRAQVMGLSDNVKRTDAGAVEVDGTGAPIHHHTTIRPEFKQGATGTSEPDYETRKDTTNVTNLAELDQRYRASDHSRGAGADATIRFSPVAGTADTPVDVALAHELQHALHTTQGTIARGDWTGYGRDATPPPLGAGPVPNAERQAVGLDFFGAHAHDPVGCTENQYRMERNTLGIGDPLRLRHHYLPPDMFAPDPTDI
ncbi:MAG: type III secretion system effector protein [Deltaproteobacteria bacterium]|nr:type III secretion system effector protein [Deltaproteobacteria bacterium]